MIKTDRSCGIEINVQKIGRQVDREIERNWGKGRDELEQNLL